MKKLLLYFLLFSSTWVYGQSKVITGRITDGTTGQPLPGATIMIQKSTSGTVTDVDGEFQLRVPANDDVQLLIQYLGYSEKSVNLSPDNLEFLTIAMEEFNTELSTVNIYGYLEGQQKALNQQKNSATIKNIVSADQIGRFPDPNVAEALQRIPGATLQRDQGEGRYVIIRGLAPQFTNVSINGEQIPSPEAGVRFVALDAIPADQLSSIEVYKTLRPDIDGDAVGGSVNLITRKARGGDMEIQGTVAAGYNNLMNKPNGQGSILIGKRYGAKEQFGVLINGSHYFTDRGSDNWERDESELELRDYELRRTRSAVSATLDYRFSANSELYARAIYNDFSDREWRRRFVFVPNVDESPFEDNEIERLTKDRYEQQVISSYNLGGRHTLPGITIDYEISYSNAFQDTPFDYEVNFIAEPDDLSTGFSDPDFPTFTTNDDFSYLNSANYEFDEFETENTYTEDENITGKINIGIPYDLGSSQGLMKFGGKYRAKTKSLEVNSNVFEWAGGDITFEGQEGDFTAEKFEGGLLDADFLGGHYPLSLAPDMGRFVRFFNDNKSGFELNVEDKLVNESVESFVASEDVLAAYLMTDLTVNNLQIVGGIRFEQTNVDYNYNTVFFDDEGDLDEIAQESGTSDYTFILPQLNLKYMLSPLTNLRFAATRSYARPNFESIVPSQEINLQDREGLIGNANLNPVSSTNLDLMVDHYFGTVGVLSLGVFHKRLQDFIYRRVFETSIYEGIDFGTDIELRQDVNGENANLTGIEIAYQQNLTFLPGFLSGLGMYLNYTYTASNAELVNRTEVGLVEEIDLPGQAAHVGNLSLSYTSNKFSARLSANYAGAYIEELDEEPEADRFISARLQLDASANFQINDNFSVFAEMLNITDAPFEAYLGGNEDVIVQREFYSWWSRAGLKFNF